MKQLTIVAASALVLLTSCGPREHLGVINMRNQDPREVEQARSLPTFIGQPPNPIVRFIDSINATSCKNLLTDPPATRGNALEQLRLKALRLGANAVINLSYDTRGTDTFGTNCWESVTASGDAVVLSR